MRAPRAAGPVISIAVSLKMYLDVRQTERWVREVVDLVGDRPEIVDGLVELAVLPSLPALPRVVAAVADAPIRIGAQDLHFDDRGAVTGGVSGHDLRTIGCTLVEINHAERRRIFHEDESVASAKLSAAVRNDLTPLICVGEREPMSSSAAASSCANTLSLLLDGIGRDVDRVIVAYEPEWAIGAARAADPGHVLAVARGIGERVGGHPLVHHASVIYGGSAGPGLLPLLADGVDGLFLGRFAHDPRALGTVLDEAAELARRIPSPQTDRAR